LPVATIFPSSNTTILSALITVDSLWAIDSFLLVRANGSSSRNSHYHPLGFTEVPSVPPSVIPAAINAAKLMAMVLSVHEGLHSHEHVHVQVHLHPQSGPAPSVPPPQLSMSTILSHLPVLQFGLSGLGQHAMASSPPIRLSGWIYANQGCFRVRAAPHAFRTHF
jgi:hypothetical protein